MEYMLELENVFNLLKKIIDVGDILGVIGIFKCMEKGELLVYV